MTSICLLYYFNVVLLFFLYYEGPKVARSKNSWKGKESFLWVSVSMVHFLHSLCLLAFFLFFTVFLFLSLYNKSKDGLISKFFFIFFSDLFKLFHLSYSFVCSAILYPRDLFVVSLSSTVMLSCFNIQKIYLKF